jgi:hypothetical protein
MIITQTACDVTKFKSFIVLPCCYGIPSFFLQQCNRSSIISGQVLHQSTYYIPSPCHYIWRLVVQNWTKQHKYYDLEGVLCRYCMWYLCVQDTLYAQILSSGFYISRWSCQIYFSYMIVQYSLDTDIIASNFKAEKNCILYITQKFVSSIAHKGPC